mmetsp:Transcript_10161/g.24203  ORF Transcript_10161/g.24203 Transcript_10161/m.24203 type:complete len:425 (+) Transcript_10161:1845-3119(+)
MVLEDLLADQRAVILGRQPLGIPIPHGLEDLDELPVVVLIDELGHGAPPHQLDHIVPRPAEQALELLDHLGVASHGAVQALVVAVHDEAQVVQPLPATDCDGAYSLGLIHLSVPNKTPHAAVGSVLQPAHVQVPEVTGLVGGHQRPQPHGHGGVLPEIGHQPRVRVTGETLPSLDLLAEVEDTVDGQPPLQEGTGVGARRRVALHVQRVPHPVAFLPAEEVVLEHLNKVSNPRERSNVAPHPGRPLVGVAHHHRRIPPDDVADLLLHHHVTGVGLLLAAGDGVVERGDRGLADGHVQSSGLVKQHVQQKSGPVGAGVLHHGLKGLKPILRHLLVHGADLIDDVTLVGEEHGGDGVQLLQIQAAVDAPQFLLGLRLGSKTSLRQSNGQGPICPSHTCWQGHSGKPVSNRSTGRRMGKPNCRKRPP